MKLVLKFTCTLHGGVFPRDGSTLGAFKCPRFKKENKKKKTCKITLSWTISATLNTGKAALVHASVVS